MVDRVLRGMCLSVVVVVSAGCMPAGSSSSASRSSAAPAAPGGRAAPATPASATPRDAGIQPVRCPKAADRQASLRSRIFECVGELTPLLSPDGSVLVTEHTAVTETAPCKLESKAVVQFRRFAPPRGWWERWRDVAGYEVLACTTVRAHVGPLRHTVALRDGRQVALELVMDSAPEKATIAVLGAADRVEARATCEQPIIAEFLVCQSAVHRRLLVTCVSGFGGDCSPSSDPEHLMFE
jgi:hypothetical protein